MSSFVGMTGEASTPSKRIITLEECKKHVHETDCWLIIHGKVYDITKFVDEHPGGFDILLSSTGVNQFPPCNLNKTLGYYLLSMNFIWRLCIMNSAGLHLGYD